TISPQIGVLKEKSLHSGIKDWYAQEGDLFEVPYEGYVIDIIRDSKLIEIQTGNFGSIKNKLNSLSKSNQIELIYPIIENKWIIRLDETGVEISKRKSPKRGKIEDIFSQLIFIPEVIIKPEIQLHVLILDVNEFWKNDGKGSWRRKKWSKVDQKIIRVTNSIFFTTIDDYQNLIAKGIPKKFTSSDLALNNDISKKQAQKMCYALRKMNLIKNTGKSGRSYIYEISNLQDH
ncbi:MAG: hypothetical protein HOH75_01725, partial [Chloroflexi bacterium]|nr:hypothetical protein [Chloroflexota bacterium]